MSGHTPLPWTTRKARPGHDRDVGIVAPGCAGVIAECFEEFRAKGERHPEEAEANAEYIVRACNSHEELLEALRQIDNEAGCPAAEYMPALPRIWEIARAAIAKAKGR